MQEYETLKGAEAKFSKTAQQMERDMADMLQYVQLLTDQLLSLRLRCRSAENVLHALRKSGETSVEAMLDTLITLRLQLEQLEEQLNRATALVQQKEVVIKCKEE